MERHQVIVVHGTFNAPEPGRIKWYQYDTDDPHNFCHRLDEALAGTAVGPAVVRDPDAAFAWSGENDHAARIQAATALAERLAALGRQQPDVRVHLVGHSHGGNVILKAVELYYAHLRAEAGRIVRRLREYDDLPVDAAARAVLAAALPSLQGEPPEAWVRLVAAHIPAIRGDVPAVSALRRLRTFVWSDAMKAFARDWMESPDSNRLGRLVCLGTPFYRKQWIGPESRALRVGRDIASQAYVLPFYALALYPIVMVYVGLAALFPGVPFVGWNPAVWPVWLQGLLGLLSIAGFALGGISDPYYNTNVYFDERAHLGRLNVRTLSVQGETDVSGGGSRPRGELNRRRVPALVVSAPGLDEALLALSSEALVHADLEPRVRQLLSPRLRFNRPGWMRQTTRPTRGGGVPDAAPVEDRPADMAIGVDTMATSEFYRGMANSFLGLLVRLTYIVVWPVWALLRRVVIQPFLTRSVLAIVSGAAYGLPPGELRGARMAVSHRIDIPSVFDETVVDVSAQVLMPAAPAATRVTPRPSDATVTVEGPRSRYAHLIDDAALATRIAERDAVTTPGHWHTLRAAMPALYRRYRDSFAYEAGSANGDGRRQPLDQDAFEQDLARTWFTLEERAREVSGAVELNHALYYSNPDVIARIAAFLADQVADRASS